MAVDMRKLLVGLGCVPTTHNYTYKHGDSSVNLFHYDSKGWDVLEIMDNRGKYAAGVEIHPKDGPLISASISRLQPERAQTNMAALSLAADIADAYNRERGE